MSKKRPNKKQSGNPAARAAQEAANREAHVRTVLEREGDPRYAQRTNNPDGSSTISISDPETAAEIQEGLDGLRARFREQFGRDMGPEDPVFWDPNKDTPQPMSDASADELFRDASEMMLRSGFDPAYVHAWEVTGYMLSEQNRHLLSAHEVQAFNDAMDAYRDEHPDLYDDSDDEDFDDEGVPVIDTTGMAPDDAQSLIVSTVQQALEAAVAACLEGPDHDLPARSVLTLLDLLFVSDEDAEFAIRMVLPVVMGWLTGAREHGINAAEVFTWLSENVTGDLTAVITDLGGIIGFAFAPDLTLSEIVAKHGETMLFPALVLLAAAVVATAGKGNSAWLRQFDLNIA